MQQEDVQLLDGGIAPYVLMSELTGYPSLSLEEAVQDLDIASKLLIGADAMTSLLNTLNVSQSFLTLAHGLLKTSRMPRTWSVSFTTPLPNQVETCHLLEPGHDLSRRCTSELHRRHVFQLSSSSPFLRIPRLNLFDVSSLSNWNMR